MKKHLSLVLSSLLVVSLFTGCGGNTKEYSAPASSAPAKEETKASEKTIVLNFMLNSPENTEFYNELFAEYNKVKPNVTIEPTILQNDYQTVLKTKINSGEVPDLFISSAYNDNIVFKDYIYNLTNEAFMKEIDDTALKGVTVGGEITGYPLNMQSHSFIYNKQLFADAGITELPKTLSEYEESCKKLVAKGIQPFGSGFAEWWVLPQTTYPSMSDAYNGDYVKLFEDVKSGTLKFGDLPQVDFALDLIDLIRQYGGDKAMESTLDMQCSDFANGKVAMIHQGIWAENSIEQIKPDIQMGFLQAPRLDGKSVIAVDSNITFRVAKDSENRDEVLAFLNWLTTSDYGQKWVPDKLKQFSTQKGAPAPETQIAAETTAAIAEGVTCPWWIFAGPDGIEQPFGIAFQNYAAGGTSREQAKEALTKVFVDAFYAQ